PVIAWGEARPIGHALPGAPDPALAAEAAGVRTELVARRASRLDGDRAPLLGDEDPTGLLRALITGDQAGVPPETLAILPRPGTSHLLSISGFHVGAAAGLAALIAGTALRAIGAVRAIGVPLDGVAGVAAAAAWLYTALASWPVPAERAAATLTAGA